MISSSHKKRYFGDFGSQCNPYRSNPWLNCQGNHSGQKEHIADGESGFFLHAQPFWKSGVSHDCQEFPRLVTVNMRPLSIHTEPCTTSPAAVAAAVPHHQITDLLDRHAAGDWGEISEDAGPPTMRPPAAVMGASPPVTALRSTASSG